MNSSGIISAELGIRLLVPGEDAVVPLAAGLRYSADDPYAVRLAFHVGLEEPVEWVFGRDLLCEGVEGPAGEGDVRVSPGAEPVNGTDEETLTIEISSPYGRARFEAPVWEVAEFLCRTYQLVPEGEESGHINMDDELSALLRESR